MRKTRTMMIAASILSVPALATAADKCPAELSQAKAMLGKATTEASKTSATAPRQLAGARAQDIQAPRAQDIQAPRAQDIQAPRAQDIQAPRAQEIQAPRAQDIQAPRAQDIQAPRAQVTKGSDTGSDAKARLDKARKLINDSEAACKRGDMALSTSKAKEAMGLMK